MSHERNCNQNHDEGLLHVHKKSYDIYISNNPQEVTSFRENVGKSEPLFTTSENNGGTTIVRHHWWQLLQNDFFDQI